MVYKIKSIVRILASFFIFLSLLSIIGCIEQKKEIKPVVHNHITGAWFEGFYIFNSYESLTDNQEIYADYNDNYDATYFEKSILIIYYRGISDGVKFDVPKVIRNNNQLYMDIFIDLSDISSTGQALNMKVLIEISKEDIDYVFIEDIKIFYLEPLYGYSYSSLDFSIKISPDINNTGKYSIYTNDVFYLGRFKYTASNDYSYAELFDFEFDDEEIELPDSIILYLNNDLNETYLMYGENLLTRP